MDQNENFCLRLNGFENNVKLSWQDLQTDQIFCDITLACDNKQIEAHKAILSACSPVIRNILKTDQNSHPLIYLRMVKYRNLQNLITFMYQGEVNVAEEELTSFLDIAEDLQIRGLSEGNKEFLTLEGEESSPPFHQNIDPFSDIRDGETINKHISMKSYNDTLKSGEGLYYNETVNNSPSLKNESSLKVEKKIKKKERIRSLVPVSESNKLNCSECDKCFSSRQLLDAHKKLVHEGIGYPCNQCAYKAGLSSGLKTHIESIHEGVRHTCNYCDYKATTKSNIKRHMLKKHSLNTKN